MKVRGFIVELSKFVKKQSLIKLNDVSLLLNDFRQRTKRKAVNSGVLRWPNGEIPYEFKYGAYSK